MREFYRLLTGPASAACVWALAMLSSPALAFERIAVLALFKDKAILQIDGARRVLAKGEVSPEGVKLVAADTEQAIIEHGGKRETLALGVIAGSFKGGDKGSVTLYANGAFFYADGNINNQAVRFLVDTGANTVALNSALAERLKIDYKRGQRGMATTASGYVPVYGIKLQSVRIGDIEIFNVDAGVIEGPEPATPLLGMSFLGGLEMRREGDRMELRQR